MEEFREIGDVQIEVPKKKEAIICKEHFEKDVKGESTGIYI